MPTFDRYSNQMVVVKRFQYSLYLMTCHSPFVIVKYMRENFVVVRCLFAKFSHLKKNVNRVYLRPFALANGFLFNPIFKVNTETIASKRIEKIDSITIKMFKIQCSNDRGYEPLFESKVRWFD